MRTLSPPVRAAATDLAAPAPPAGLDPAFAARPRLARLRDALAAPRPTRRTRWGEPAVFFFDRRRQAELEAARPPAPPPAPDPLGALIAAELPALFRSVEVRRVARAIPGLHTAATARAAESPPAKDLADLLAVPDDETVVVLHPATRTGFRLHVQGVVDLHQFQLLMLDATAGGWGDGEEMVPARAVAACRDTNPVLPAAPVVAQSRFRFFAPAALRADGTLPEGFAGCGHWLWGAQPLAAVPRVGGERVILLGEPAFPETWEVERRFPALPAVARLVETLDAAQVADRLGQLTGRPVPSRPTQERVEELAEAA